MSGKIFDMNDKLIQERKEIIANCMEKYNIPVNINIDDELLNFEYFPKRITKTLALIVLAYKREVTKNELKKISDRESGLVSDLRKLGFIFEKKKGNYIYKNSNGEFCRKIVSIDSKKIIKLSKIEKIFIKKSFDAAIAALEIYNKPYFHYREEAFSLLMVNSWELLLKAKYINFNNGNEDCIYENKSKNRNNNRKSVGVIKIIGLLKKKGFISSKLAKNLEGLIKIRDNATHNVNIDKNLAEAIYGYALASVRNYTIAIERWFKKDLSTNNFYLMPISFFPINNTENISTKRNGSTLMKDLEDLKILEEEDFKKNDDFFIKAKISKGIEITEENLKESIKGKLTSKKLKIELKENCKEIKFNKKFNEIIKRIKSNKKFVYKYLTNPEKKDSVRYYYNVSAVNEICKLYRE